MNTPAKNALFEAATLCRDANEFVREIKRSPALLSALYLWENSTPENKARFKSVGWFGIAATFWEENNKQKA